MARDRKATRLICTLTAGDATSMHADLVTAASAGADAVECRLDYLRPIPDAAAMKALLSGHPVEVIATCRPVRQGGHFEGSESQRLDVLRRAGQAGATFVDVEDDVPVADWPAGRVIRSFHDMVGRPGRPGGHRPPAGRVAGGGEQAGLRRRRTRGRPARRWSCCGSAASRRSPWPWARPGLPAGFWRGKFGAFGTFASLDRRAPSRPRASSPWPRCAGFSAGTPHARDERLSASIGCPVAHSMSPAIHNAAFAAAGLDAVYVPAARPAGRGQLPRASWTPWSPGRGWTGAG